MVTKAKYRVMVDGFDTGATAFADTLEAAGQEKQEEFRAQILDPLVAALNSTSEVAVLSIIGQSEPDDNEALSRGEQIGSELSYSSDRVVSAIDYIENVLAAEVPGYEAGSWEQHQQFAIGRFAVGASNPNEVDEGATEEERARRNRAVTFSMLRFSFE